MLRCFILLLIAGLLTTQKIYAQNAGHVISGLVTSQEDGTPLPGVLVYVRGTKNASGTQQDGMYYIEVTDKDSILVFSYDDFQTREVRLTGADSYNIVLVKAPAQPRAPAQRKEMLSFSPAGAEKIIVDYFGGLLF